MMHLDRGDPAGLLLLWKGMRMRAVVVVMVVFWGGGGGGGGRAEATGRLGRGEEGEGRSKDRAITNS